MSPTGKVARHCGWREPDLCDHPHCLLVVSGQTLPARPVFALNTGDPRFDPKAPVTVNGFRYIPESFPDSGGGEPE